MMNACFPPSASSSCLHGEQDVHVCAWACACVCARLEKDWCPLVQLTSSRRPREDADVHPTAAPRNGHTLSKNVGRMIDTIPVERAEWHFHPVRSSSKQNPGVSPSDTRCWSRYPRGLKKIKTGVRLTPCECWCVTCFWAAFWRSGDGPRAAA